MLFIEMIIAGEGICIFLILVVSRKRVLKVIANEWFVDLKIFPDTWRTMQDSEAELETENEENFDNTFNVHFNAISKHETTNEVNASGTDTEIPDIIKEA